MCAKVGPCGDAAMCAKVGPCGDAAMCASWSTWPRSNVCKLVHVATQQCVQVGPLGDAAMCAKVGPRGNAAMCMHVCPVQCVLRAFGCE